jgi:hypothetical protein
MRFSLLGVWLMVGCFHAVEPDGAPDASPDEPLEVTAEAQAKVGLPRNYIAGSEARDTVFVAGCNVACEGCALGDYRTFVIGKLARTGERIFPTPEPLSPGYSCAANVKVGERVTLIAHSPQGFVIDEWRRFFAGDACPCEGTRAMKCTFTVTPEIASQYDRVYCGAAWKPQHMAQIGH